LKLARNAVIFIHRCKLVVELLDELKETAAPALAKLEAEERADIDEVVGMLTGNLEKIAEHGRRADGIVKSMLEHSRGASGERREVDLNGLVEEALNLAYHGARAQDASFNITLERDFDTAIVPIELAPQEMTRVLLNLFGNGFYAATKRQRNRAESDFRPALKGTTREFGSGLQGRHSRSRRSPPNQSGATRVALFAMRAHRGTGSSNPLPSSGESTNFRFPSRRRPLSRYPGRNVMPERLAETLRAASESGWSRAVERSPRQRAVRWSGARCGDGALPHPGQRRSSRATTYEAPYAAVAPIKDHLAFYLDRVDAIEERPGD
jgi:hypothetical protein